MAVTANESTEQQALFEWAGYSLGKYPELEWMYHVPNGGKRSNGAGGRLKAEGLKAGVPDVCLPVARCGYHGLYIEMKYGKNTTSPEQKLWLKALAELGYAVAVCHGWESAMETIVDYMDENTVKA